MSAAMHHLELIGMSKHYGSGAHRTEVLSDINLSVAEGEFVAILGASGAGKTTLISLIAGLLEPDAGSIRLRGTPIDGPGRDRGVVFQSYALLPWLSVRGNIALAVDSQCRELSRSDRAARVQRYIDRVGLGHAAERRPAELSGGMRQRVAVARALSMQPELLLLDEPLSALDALTRAKLQDEFAALSQAEKRTIVMITNDVDEALLLADRIVPLTPAPNATLGPSFRVALPRPRERAAMNSDAEYIRLRAAVTECLLDLGAARRQQARAARSLPNVVPITHAPTPPEAYQRAAHSKVEQRYVEFSQVSKRYPAAGGALTVVDGFDLKLQKGEFVSLIGHSGCGKSTVLAMVAGLTDVSSGGVILDGREIVGAGPERAVVFQAPSLLPWLTARENVALGVDRVYPRATPAERREVVEYYLERVGLGDRMHTQAAELSNGMQQRVGIARAFALSPKLLLLDEPFGMLDSQTRWELQDLLMEVWARTKVTAICVTHDVDEAILLADRVVMMTNGPRARIGNIMRVELPRPRTRRQLLAHRDYYGYREELLDFLDAYEGGADPSAEHLQRIRDKRVGAVRLPQQRPSAA
jgi:nitrate/nitrite transport system ATP-binding protein